ncbi:MULTISPECIES: hypothetical protein [Vibrio]|uniref:hypothetical protein n=1 Tax=Vibrio TaxID=662 RepID=UPI000C85CCF6|nr:MULTISPECIES: hypothetical protein [Vibrio]NNN79695.1 hypothetical protein [Vibrio sp. 11-4(1)]PMP48130.1 hypothetical protein BCS86_23945 [Vibrio splendidus]
MITSIAHCVTPTNNAVWLNTNNNNLVLSLVQTGTEDKVLPAFGHANSLIDQVRNNLVSEKLYDEGLFLLSLSDMTKQLMVIDGMSLTSSSNQIKPFQGTPSEINLDFFEFVLICKSDELKYINPFLMRYMRNLQLIAKEYDLSSAGFLLGYIEYNSLIKKVQTNFTYISITDPTMEAFKKINCQSDKPLNNYPYQFDVGRFSYVTS